MSGKGALFHAGELALQERAGVRDRLDATAPRFVREFMPDQHRDFFARLPTLLVGSLDARRRPWASILFGAPGFAHAPDPWHLTVHARPLAGDALSEGLAVGAPLGLLGIEPHTRRRNRLNGTIVDLAADRFTVEVDQSFGNCAQYIQARAPEWVQRSHLVESMERGDGLLDRRSMSVIEQADTFYIATAAAEAHGRGGAQGVDVSHRGGKPGFVRVRVGPNGTELVAPDFRGNFLFNTLGNIAANPHAGLLFIDYEHGDLLQLTGTAEIVWEGLEVEAFAGAQRLLRIRVTSSRWFGAALPLRWTPPQQAPQLASTGAWRS